MLHRLYLLRHAEPEEGAIDFDRSLTLNGKAQSIWIGHYLKEQEIQPQHIVSSPAMRALTTAQLVAKQLMLPVVTEPAIYNADVDTLLKIIHAFDDKQKNILFVGHNPGTTLLSYYLTDEIIEAFSPGNLGVIEFDVPNWQSITEKSGKLISFVTPQISFSVE